MNYYISVFFLIASFSLRAQPPQTKANYFINPIIAGYNPDPSICRVGEDYYIVTSSFTWFPGIPIYHSKDLINWELIGYALTRKSQLNLDKGSGIYAATIRFNNGLFYIITTNRRNGENFFVTAANPKGAWSDPIWIEQKGIDPSLYFENGKTYFTSTTSDGIIACEIDSSNGKILSDTKLIWRGTGGRYQEAPHLYKIKGIYYLLIAEGGTEYGHFVSIARSNAIWGPYESNPNNPILTQRNRSGQSSIIQGSGHADIVQSQDGNWWMVFLAFRAINNHHHLGRETFLTPFSWNATGWPIIPFDGTAQIDNYTKTLPLQPFATSSVRDDFNNGNLELAWNFLCNPQPNSWSLTERKGFLRIHGLKGNLDSSRSPQLIGQRQKYFDCIAETNIEFNPQKENEEAGLSVYHMPGGHYDLFIRKKGLNREVVLRYVLGKIVHEEKSAIITKGQVVLKVESDKNYYTFSFSQGADHTLMGMVDTKFLSSETLNSFLGNYICLFAAGNNANCETPADFDWFQIKSVEK